MIDWETFKSQLRTNPGKVLKSVLLLAGCFLVIWILVIMQSNLGIREPVRNSGRLDSLNMTLAPGPAGDSLQSTAPPPKFPAHATNQTAPQSGYFSLLPILLVFLIFIAAVWFWLRSKSKNDSLPAGAIFTTVASQQLPGEQQLLIGKLNGEYWVMATGGTQGTTLLHRYSEDEWNGPTRQSPKNDWKKTFNKALKSSVSKEDRQDS